MQRSGVQAFAQAGFCSIIHAAFCTGCTTTLPGVTILPIFWRQDTQNVFNRRSSDAHLLHLLWRPGTTAAKEAWDP